jgi:uncharacterized protein (UPF0276 family)
MPPVTPVIGFGLDAQYATRYPEGIDGLCDRYRSHLSHLSIVSLPSVAAARRFRARCAQSLPIIHHLSGVAPADPDGPHMDRLARLDEISAILEPLWACEDVGIWSIGPYSIPYFAPPIFEPDVADLIGRRICAVLEASPYRYSAEVPACPFIVGSMSLGDFFHRLVELSDCKVVLDVSHVYSYAVARREAPFDVLRSLPLDSVCEVHVSGGVLSHNASNRYVDTHSHPVLDDVIDLAVATTEAAPDLQGITYEIGVGLSAADIERDVRLLEEHLARTPWQPFSRTPRSVPAC